MSSYNLTHLKELESEAIFILREVAAQFEKPVILFQVERFDNVSSYKKRHFNHQQNSHFRYAC